MESITNRRDFVQRVGAWAGGTWLALSLPACERASEYALQAAAEGRAFTVLTDDEARVVEAICGRILPSGELPGATEAGAVYFVDQVLSDAEEGSLPLIRSGLERLEARTRSAHAGVRSFADLDAGRQIELLRDVEADDPAFFGTIRYLTLCGTLAHPSYGGNRDHLGWRMLGMDVQPSFSPPFGYYDRPYHEGAVQ